MPKSSDPTVVDLVAMSPVASVVTDPHQRDNPIIACNEAFMELTGYSEPEIIGRNCRFLSGPDTEPWLTEAIQDGVRDQRPVLVEILNYKKDGTPFRNAVVVAPVFDEEGELAYFFGSQVELVEDALAPSLSRRAQAAEKVRELSRRQMQVLQMVAKGLRNKQIAFELGLSEKTVKMHRGLAMDKLGARSSAEMVRLAVEAGI